VLGIDNSIALSSDPIPSDVADRIQKAFQRNAIIDDSRITSATSATPVQLDGVVNSWAARSAAEDMAWQAPGVMQVVDDLLCRSVAGRGLGPIIGPSPEPAVSASVE